MKKILNKIYRVISTLNEFKVPNKNLEEQLAKN